MFKKCIYTLGMVAWDESKRRINLKKHKIDIAELDSAFDSPMSTEEDDRDDYGEQRLQSLAFWRGRVVYLIWTDRNESPHIISCRYAEPSQIKEYFELFY